VPAGEHDACGGNSPPYPAQVGHVNGDRLLGVGVLSGRGGRLDQRGVLVVRRGDHHGVEIVPAEQGGQRVVLVTAELGGEAGAALRVPGVAAAQLDELAAGVCAGHDPRPPAETDRGQADAGHAGGAGCRHEGPSLASASLAKAGLTIWL
jgi:hypothetical protein